MPLLRKIHSLLFIISGPAGTGKTTLSNRLVQNYAPKLNRVVTATTRLPRKGEVCGIDYHFLDIEEFEAKVSEGAFLEDAVVHGNRYGVLKSEVLEKMNAGLDLVISLDVQGAAAFRRAAEQDTALVNRLVSLFLMPGDMETIHDRLKDRAADDEDEINRRLVVAEDEISQWREFDYCIVSGSKDEDFGKAESIYKAECLRVRRLAGEQ